MFQKGLFIDEPKVNLEMRRQEMAEDSTFGKYVRDGLLFWWDGINNTLHGHDPTSTKWEDLSGNGHHATYNSKNIIGDDYLSPNGAGLQYVALSTEEKELYKTGMVEVVIWPKTGTGSKSILSPVGNVTTRQGPVYIHSNATCIGFTYGSGSGGGRCVELLRGKHYYNGQFYRDGVKVSNANNRQTWSSSSNYLGSYKTATSNVFIGKIYAIRAYSRVLSDEEIMQNWLEDKRRFSIIDVINIDHSTTNCYLSERSTQNDFVEYGGEYSCTITPDIGFEMASVSVTMNGIDITSSVYDNTTSKIYIPSVTGVINIICTATITNYVWDYEWDYTDGLLTDNGWSQGNWNTGGVATMTEDGLELTSANSSNISFRKLDYLVSSGIMEVTLSGTYNTSTAYINTNVCLSNGTTGVNFITPKGNGGVRNNSTVGSCTTFGAVPTGTDYTVRLALDGNSGNIAIDNIVKWRTNNVSGTSLTYAATTRVCSESQQSGYSTIVKSIRIKRLDQGGT